MAVSATLAALFLLRLLELRGQFIGVLGGVELGLARQNAGLAPGLIHLRLQRIDGLAVGFARNRGGFVDLGNLVHQGLARGFQFRAHLPHLVELIKGRPYQGYDRPKKYRNLRAGRPPEDQRLSPTV